MMGNQKRARTQVGEMLVAMIVQDIGSSQHAVVIEGDDVTPARTVVLNKPEADPLTGAPYLSNDLQRTMLQVGLQDVPSSPTYYQAPAMPFLASLMDVPFKRALVEALRDAAAHESPEQVEQRIQKAVADALAKAGNDLKARARHEGAQDLSRDPQADGGCGAGEAVLDAQFDNPLLTQPSRHVASAPSEP